VGRIWAANSELTMGRWGGFGRQTVEALPCIEIGALRRAGYIGKVPGNWWVHRERLSRKGIQPNHWTDRFVSLAGEALQVTWMPWHFGGCRAYFLCACGRTVEKLYAPRGRLWRCRHCHDLSYESRQTAPHYRQLVKAQKIRERLAGSRNMLVEFRPLRYRYAGNCFQPDRWLRARRSGIVFLPRFWYSKPPERGRWLARELARTSSLSR